MADYPEDARHVSPEERAAALDPNIGDGTPNTADEVLPEEGDWDKASLVPTRKWVVARIIACAGLATMWATTGSWDLEETVGGITLLSEGLVSWLTPNAPEPGGVPHR